MKTIELKNGKKYKVTHRASGGKIATANRIFKWEENRFGSMLCLVFTSRVNKSVKAIYNEKEGSLSMSGTRLPCSELSIPYYNLIEAIPIN